MRPGRGVVLSLFFALSSSSSQVARAEGSAEFDAADVGGTHLGNDQALTEDTALYVDILDGNNEQICWRGNGAVIVSQPNGTVIDTIDSAPGPANPQCAPAVGGVNGAYRLQMQSPQLIGTEWDLRVCPKTVGATVIDASACFTGSTNERVGRLWSYDWNFQENTNFANNYSINGSVFAIVPGGEAGRDAVIEMQMRGVSGAQYHLLANGVGPEQNTSNTRIGRSVPTMGYHVTPSFPLYLNLPAKALYNWTKPQITNVQLAPNCGGGIVQDRPSPGSLSFNSNVTGQYVVVCDVDKNGIYDFAAQTDFSSFGAASVGTNTVTWNGRNNANMNAAEGDYNCQVRLNVGEFHYMAEDIETSYPGIRMFRIEADKATRTAIQMFWDDTLIPVDMENMGNGQRSPNSPLAGGLDPGPYAAASSPFYFTGGNTSMPQGNARAWGNYDSDGKGNNAFLDQFASADTAISPPFVVKVMAAGSDADSDGLTNTRECDLGSNPTNNDSDGDGVPDGTEATSSTMPNTDNDGPIDILDPDSDNDGVNDGMDVDRLNPSKCRDMDGDQCDDCTLTGSNKSGGNPSGDGTDTDSDGACNTGDADDDNDGVPDAMDSAPLDPDACRDVDGDGCDDCGMTGANGSGGDTGDDGDDADHDGLCDEGSPGSGNNGDPDDDNDGVDDGADVAPDDPKRCRDQDMDGCDDCAITGANKSGGDPNNDGPDSNGDGRCDSMGVPQTDSDGDGVDDEFDLDRDNDGIPNSAEGSGDLDGDGNPNDLDLDSDGDGRLDVLEGGGGALDANGDGAIDTLRDDSPKDGLHDPLQLPGAALPLPDSDGDGKPDFLDALTDSDNDGVADEDDLDRDNDGIPNSAEGDGDLDGDGIPNALDLDSDGDGLRDVLEAGGGDLDKNGDGRIDAQDDVNPKDGLHDPLQQPGAALPLPDSDGDGDPDFLDADMDSDHDGVADDKDLDRDNDGIPNSAEGDGDLDGDGVPNALDLDSDGDGLTDVAEAGGADLDKDGDGRIDSVVDSDPQDGLHDPLQRDGAALPLPDTDGDGAPDFLDPSNDDADDDDVKNDQDLDRDGDGIPDSAEGDGDLDGDGIPNLLDLDSDGDGVSDIVEAGGRELDADGDGRIDDMQDTSPRDGLHDPLQRDGGALPLPDSDGDGKPDFLDPDDDGDGVPTRDERPGDEDVDTDGDGDPDYLDPDDDDDGLSTRDERPNDQSVDTDEDGKPDYLDPDDDGDGLSTRDERPDDQSVDTDDDGKPDYLDPDDDDDGVPTADELDEGRPRDTDKDGKPDHLDADDDGDGVPTRDERTDDGKDRDTDDDGTPDYLDPDDDGDGIPTEDEPSDANNNGKPDRLEPEERGTLAGGALCSVRQPGSPAQGLILLPLLLLSIAAAGVLRGRRRRTRRRWLLLIAAGGVFAGQHRAHAQVALDQYRPASLATDGFAIGRPTVLPHLTVGALVELDYANDPLVYEHTPGDPDSEEHVIEHDLVLHAALALGLWDRLTLFLGVPVHLMMEGDENVSVPAPAADGAGLGDVLFGGRIRIVGDDESLAALAAELLARFPTAEAADGDQSYRGDEIGSYEPALLFELRAGIFDARARAAVRLREEVKIGNLELGQEFAYGIGVRLRVAKPLVLHGEFYGTTFLNDAFAREHSPAEALFGAKLEASGWVVGAAAGPGLLRGYGSPDVRVVGMVGYAEPREPPPPPPVDSDHDGLLDLQDKCPREPEDFDQFQDADGCPDPDNDQDGVLDVTDRCRNQPEDVDSFEDDDGCPDPDNDHDGVLDPNDRCPLEPEDTDDFEDQDGCPDPDNDKDRYLDANDGCPDQPEDFDGFQDDDGCPEEGEGLVKLTCEKIEIKDSVYFDSGKDRIQERSFTLLNQVAAILTQATHIKHLRVEGHTDDRGKDAYNLELSQRRAASVLRYLVERGIAAERLVSEGYGETKPIADNKTAAGRSQNRRVEFVVMESDGCP